MNRYVAACGECSLKDVGIEFKEGKRFFFFGGLLEAEMHKTIVIIDIVLGQRFENRLCWEDDWICVCLVTI